MSLSECVEEFSFLMTQQLDMQLEAHNLVKFRENFHLHSTLHSGKLTSNNREQANATGTSTTIASLFDSYLRQWRQFMTGLPERVTFPEPLMDLTTPVRTLPINTHYQYTQSTHLIHTHYPQTHTSSSLSSPTSLPFFSPPLPARVDRTVPRGHADLGSLGLHERHH